MDLGIRNIVKAYKALEARANELEVENRTLRIDRGVQEKKLENLQVGTCVIMKSDSS